MNVINPIYIFLKTFWCSKMQKLFIFKFFFFFSDDLICKNAAARQFSTQRVLTQLFIISIRSVTWQQFLGDLWPILHINFQIAKIVQIHILENSNSYLFVSMGKYMGFVDFCFWSLFYCFGFVFFFPF